MLSTILRYCIILQREFGGIPITQLRWVIVDSDVYNRFRQEHMDGGPF